MYKVQEIYVSYLHGMKLYITDFNVLSCSVGLWYNVKTKL